VNENSGFFKWQRLFDWDSVGMLGILLVLCSEELILNVQLRLEDGRVYKWPPHSLHLLRMQTEDLILGESDFGRLSFSSAEILSGESW